MFKRFRIQIVLAILGLWIVLLSMMPLTAYVDSGAATQSTSTPTPKSKLFMPVANNNAQQRKVPTVNAPNWINPTATTDPQFADEQLAALRPAEPPHGAIELSGPRTAGARIIVADKVVQLPMDAQLDGMTATVLCYQVIPNGCPEPPLIRIKRNGRVLDAELNSGRMRMRFGISDGEKQEALDTFAFIIDAVGEDKLIDPIEHKVLIRKAAQELLASVPEK